MANNAGHKNPALTKRGRFNANTTPSGGNGCLIEQRAKEARSNHVRLVRTFRNGKWRSQHAEAV